MTTHFSLYVHVPFCTHKCSYCDFNSYANQESLIPTYTEALIREARLWSASCRGRTADTLYLGGGTPSLMPLEALERIMEGLRDSFRLSDELEATLEANPGTVDEDYLRGLRAIGINRLSLGVQSLDGADLAFLERIHSPEESRQAYHAARRAGFDNVNVDLIFGLPRQSVTGWRRSLEGALALEPEHLSLYALTIEEGTPLARDVSQGHVPAPDADHQAEMYVWSRDRLSCAGYEHYEISNWARPGRRCRHNLTYWRNGAWLGLGAGAHSHLPWLADGETPECAYRFASIAMPSRYVRLLDQTWRKRRDGETPPLDDMPHITLREPASVALAAADSLILGLRLSEGVDFKDLLDRFGAEALATHAAALDECRAVGLLEYAGGRLRLSERGRLLANEVFVRLLPSKGHQRQQA